MLKTILMSGLLSSMLLLSGCGGDSEGEAKLEVQKMLDKGDFQGVISRLKDSASTKDEYITLASAYMGRAGLTITDIISSITAGEEDGVKNGSGFADFVKHISKTAGSDGTPLADLDQARDYFKKVVGDHCAKEAYAKKLSDTEKNVCLYIGMASTGSAAVTIDLIAGDLDSFASGDGSGDERLKASACAMKYAFDRDDDPDCNVTESSKVNFTTLKRDFIPLVVTVDADADSPKTEYYYLMNDSNQTVLTKNYCLVDDFKRYEDINAIGSLYACPINENPDSNTTTAGVLVGILNDGLNSIKNAVSGDVVDDINEFKCELLNGTYENKTCSVSGRITQAAIIDYINKENK